jgi:pSer/pThr/pTyr-binding forkhead associated (FHA) protein
MPIPLKLTVYKGSDLIGEHRFDRDIVKIGRLASAHLKLEDSKVSRIHAVIEAASDGHEYSIIDMGSTEGTFVNGEKVSKEKLRDGDEIRLGDCRLLVSFDEVEVRVPGKDMTPVLGDTVPAYTPQTLPPPVAQAPADLWAASPADLAATSPTMTMSAVSPMSFQQPSSGTPAYAQPSAVPSSVSMPAMPSQDVQQQMMQQQMMQQQMMQQQMMQQQMLQQQMMQSQIPQMPVSGISGMPIQMPRVGWGSSPNNLASDGVPESERSLEVKLLWGNTIVDSINTHDKPTVTLGDERKTTGWGPLEKLVRCDIEAPSKGLPAPTFVLAQAMSPNGCSYTINIAPSFDGRLDKADGTFYALRDILNGRQEYSLQPAETLYLTYGDLTLQIRYVRRTRMIPPGFWADLNYSWVNMLILAFFIHAMAVVSFLATPVTQAELTENIFKNPNRFAQFRLTPEEKKKQQNDFLSKLKEGAAGAKAAGSEGKAGKKDHPKDKKQGRMAVKAIDPNDKEIAKSTLAKLFGAKGNTGRSYLFGSGGLGGELKGALGGVTGAEIGDASGLGGLGTRGSGPGGGGLSMNSVGLGALGTAGRGGGNGGYGDGVGGLGKKSDRDINITPGSPIIMGSLDKELIRRVIREHLPQIRYCYEKELTRNPGLFGKVATQFTISAEGTVQSAEVVKGGDSTTLDNAEVQRCITSKIRTWVFPKPKGGGVVIVKYPFIFKTTG